RFERAGLKIVAAKMVWIDKAFGEKHYLDREAFLLGLGEKTLKSYKDYNLDPQKDFGTRDQKELGKIIRGYLIDYICSGPVVALVLEGIHAVDQTRSLAGATIPFYAAPGTIRRDFSIDSPDVANAKRRGVKNIVHISGNVEEAEYEINLWFKKEELYSYKRADEEAMF
ncbi:nucleoside-diphosphate kinase, partial [Candidatus Curtissbacteria bacterium RBG_16_39_7]